MLFLPVVSRELLVQARRKSTYRIRVTASVIAGGLMLWLLFSVAANTPAQLQGQKLFATLSSLAFVYALVAGVFATADCLSAEKREGTLGLVFLTDLKGRDVVFGKLAASSLHTIYGLLAVVPFLAVALFMGGVGTSEIAQTLLVVGNTLFFSLALGMFVSVSSRNERKAMFAAFLLSIMVSVAPFVLLVYLAAQGFMAQSPAAPQLSVLWSSPLFAFLFAQSGGATGTGGPFGPLPLTMIATQGLPPWMPRITPFGVSLALTHGMAWFLLIWSGRILPRLCHDRPAESWREKWVRRWRVWGLGDATSRALLRHNLLDRNPFLWLSSRERYRPFIVWALITPLVFIGCWAWFAYRNMFPEACIALLFIAHLLLVAWFVGETCHRWIENRQSGAMELILCAPVTVERMVAGQNAALWRQFGFPLLAVAGLHWLVLQGIPTSAARLADMEGGRVWVLLTGPLLLADVLTLRWVGMWRALTARGLNRAMGRAVVDVFVWRWLAFLVLLPFLKLYAAEEPGLSIPATRLALFLVIDFLLAWSARRKFLKHLRVMAAVPARAGEGK